MLDMAAYDIPGLTYDSGVLYDEPAQPQPNKKRMAKIKLNLFSLTEEQLLQKALDIKSGLTGNANFTTPTPSIAAVTTLITTAQSQLTACNAAQAAAKQATTDKNTAMDALRTALATWGDYVQLTSGGDVSKIQSARIDVQSARTPTVIPNQVMNLAITASDNAGELDLQWDSLPNAKSYEIQISPDPVTATSWVSQPSVTRSQASITGLTSGARMWVRVRAVNAAGQGPWADVATKIVP
jgi:hypothetical protein